MKRARPVEDPVLRMNEGCGRPRVLWVVSLRVGGVERAERRQPVAIEGSADRLTAPLALDGGGAVAGWQSATLRDCCENDFTGLMLNALLYTTYP